MANPNDPNQSGYPPQHGGYPPQQGYPPQPAGYPPQEGGYSPQQAGYPQQGGYGQQPGYPQHPRGSSKGLIVFGLVAALILIVVMMIIFTPVGKFLFGSGFMESTSSSSSSSSSSSEPATSRNVAAATSGAPPMSNSFLLGRWGAPCGAEYVEFRPGGVAYSPRTGNQTYSVSGSVVSMRSGSTTVESVWTPIDDDRARVLEKGQTYNVTRC
jgi:hypothetical protein